MRRRRTRIRRRSQGTTELLRQKARITAWDARSYAETGSSQVYAGGPQKTEPAERGHHEWHIDDRGGHESPTTKRPRKKNSAQASKEALGEDIAVSRKSSYLHRSSGFNPEHLQSKRKNECGRCIQIKSRSACRRFSFSAGGVTSRPDVSANRHRSQNCKDTAERHQEPILQEIETNECGEDKERPHDEDAGRQVRRRKHEWKHQEYDHDSSVIVQSRHFFSPINFLQDCLTGLSSARVPDWATNPRTVSSERACVQPTG